MIYEGLGTLHRHGSSIKYREVSCCGRTYCEGCKNNFCIVCGAELSYEQQEPESLTAMDMKPGEEFIMAESSNYRLTYKVVETSPWLADMLKRHSIDSHYVLVLIRYQGSVKFDTIGAIYKTEKVTRV